MLRSLSMTFSVGETVGSYRIIGQLGQGGMATVYKAYHASLDRYVAIKVLHPAFKEDKTFLGRFEREARVLAKLEHPNIVPIYDFAEHEGQPYLVMKFIEGETLKGRLATGPVPLAETLKVVEAVGSALAYAHRQGVLHRDIKPSNIILTNDGQYYLSDFGLARIASAGESTLSQDTMLGTPNYISPEQAKGVTDLDGRTDLYSFGVVLYEMIVGRVPFSGDTPYSIIHDHIYSPLPPPSVVNPAVTEPLEMFLLKALAKDREDRYADVTEMVAAFRRAANVQPDGTLGPAVGPGTSSIAARTEAWPPATVVTPQRAETVERPQAVGVGPVKGDAVTAPVAAPPAAAVAPATAPTSASNSNRIWWIVGGGLVVVLCLGIIGVLLAGRLIRDNRTRATSTASALATAAVVPTLLPTPLPPTADAVAEAQATQASAPNNVDANIRLGQAYYAAARFDEAAAAYEKAASLSNYRAVFYSTNVIAPYPADPLFALTVLSDGLRHNTDRRLQLELWVLAGPLLEKVAPLPNAESLLEGLAHDFPDRSVAQLALAQHYVLLNELDKAGPVIDQARQQFPNEPLTHFVYAEYLAASGKIDEAQAEYGIVIADPRSGPALRQSAQQKSDQLKGTPSP